MNKIEINIAQFMRIFGKSWTILEWACRNQNSYEKLIKEDPTCRMQAFLFEDFDDQGSYAEVLDGVHRFYAENAMFIMRYQGQTDLEIYKNMRTLALKEAMFYERLVNNLQKKEEKNNDPNVE